MAITKEQWVGVIMVVALVVVIIWIIYRFVLRKKDAECTVGTTCPNGRCVDGVCTDCTTNAECDAVRPGSTCVSGTCEVVTPPAGCTTDAQCPAGETCVNGRCMVGGTQSECASDEECEFGKCIDGKCEKAMCSSNEDCVDDMVCAADQCSQAPGVVYFNTPIALYSGVNETSAGYLFVSGNNVTVGITSPQAAARNWLIRPATLEAGSTRAVRFGDPVVLSTLQSYPYVLKQQSAGSPSVPVMADITQHEALTSENMAYRWVFINPHNPSSTEIIRYEDWTQLANIPSFWFIPGIPASYRSILTTFRGNPPLQLENFDDARAGSFLQILPSQGTSTRTKAGFSKEPGATQTAVKAAYTKLIPS